MGKGKAQIAVLGRSGRSSKAEAKRAARSPRQPSEAERRADAKAFADEFAAEMREECG